MAVPGGPRTIGAGGALLMTIGGGAIGAWLYQRAQRERNRPINRLRRGARDLASRFGDFDMDDLQANRRPLGGGGAAAALLISSLLIARARRRSDVPHPDIDAQQMIADVMDQSRERARELKLAERLRMAERMGLEEGSRLAERLRMAERLKNMPELHAPPRKQTIMGGLGLGGTAVLIGAGFLIWRLLRGGPQPPRHLYVTDRMGE
jgi:hypothetical protein